ncbi:MAG TPA: glycosyltransferase family 39 protein [Segetibacter sp.]|jgi:hypothetical protein
MLLKIFRKEFWKGQRLILLAFLVVHVIASYYYISYQNITFDEPQYIEYAKHWLKGKPERVERLDDSKSPVVAICWIPRITRQIINPNYKLTDYGRKDQKEGRYMMIFFSFLTAVYVYWWCKDLYGEEGWILPLLLLLFEPLYLAYTTLITTDLACGAFLLALLYHYRKYVVLRSRKDFYLSVLFATLAAVTKQNMLFALFLLPCLSLIFYFLQKENRSWFTKKGVRDLVLFIALLLVGINIIYYFHRSFVPFGEYVFESHTLQNLQQTFSFLSWMPVPLPHAYVQSVDMIKAHSEIGAGTPESTLNGVYLFGELRLKGGFWYYYIVLWFFKMPIGYILLFFASVPLFIKNFNIATFAKEYMFLIIPALYYLVILSCFNQFQIGIRHLLLIYPLMFVGLGYLFHKLLLVKKQLKILAAVAIVYSLISMSFYYPFIIPYTNELITDKKMVFTKFVDSSIDYGQADSSITDFIAVNRGYKIKSPVPDTGKYAIVMSQVVNTYLRKENPYNWYQKLKPKGLYRYVVLLYDVKQEDLINAGFATRKR